MKKSISILICISIIMSVLCIYASATENSIYKYEIDGYEYTVEIDDSNIPAEKKQAIADNLVGADEYGVAPANILCDIFGHDYLYTTSVVYKHKVYTSSPRCQKLTYDVKYCEDCDFMQQTLVNTTRVYCCPED